MPVNGQDGSITRADIIRQVSGQFVTAQTGARFPVGTEIAWGELRSMLATWQFLVYIRAPGDALFVSAGITDLLSDEYEADDLLAITGGFENLIPSGQGNTTSLKDLYANLGSYRSPNDGQTYLGRYGLAKWTGEALSSMTDLDVERATQNAFGAEMTRRRKIALNTALANAIVTPYVMPTQPTEAQQFPPLSKTIASMIGLMNAERMQVTVTELPDGTFDVGLAQPPTS